MEEREVIIFRIPAWKKEILWRRAKETNRTLSAYIEWSLRKDFKEGDDGEEKTEIGKRRKKKNG